jgi:uncharacterized repeat protein (TIGR02543 family)
MANNGKKMIGFLLALVFVTSLFLPTVRSQLGTMSIKTSVTDSTYERANLFLKNSIEINDGTIKSLDQLPLNGDPPNIHLPTTQVTMKVFSSTSSYFRTQLLNVPSGYEVSNGNYTGWCTDSAHYINLNTAYQVTLYSSYNNSLPSYLYHQNWSKVNYILNNKIGSDWHQVQYAILYILDFGNQGLNSNGWAMVNNAILYGGSYIPDGGNIIAIIADAGTTVQRTIFELTVPVYTLSISITGEGSVAKDPDEPSYTYGEVVQLTATPEVGWYFSQWEGDLSGSSNPATISMTSNKAISATFDQCIYTLTITIDPAEGGTVTADPGPPYYYGDVVTLTAEPSTGYAFDHWSGDASGSNPETTVTMNADKSVTAHFSLIEYTLTITIDPAEGGTVTADPDPPYYYGDEVTLTATPNPGYTFDHWSGDASGSSTVTTVTMDADKSVTAHFTQSQYTLTITIDPAEGGTVTADPGPPYYYGDVVTLTAEPSSGYVFDHWSGDASGSDPVTTVTMDANMSVTAHFTQSEYTLTITINPTGSGTVSAVPSPPYHYGDVVTLTASANPGYIFDHWSGDASGSSLVTTVTMDGNKSVTANFIQGFTLTIIIDGHGSVTKNPNQATYPPNTVVTLTAVPDANWVFNSWIGDLSGTENPVTITMNGNKTITAHFTYNGVDTTPPLVSFIKPINALYIFNKLIFPFKMPVIVQMITIEVNASDDQSGIKRVEFCVDGVSKSNDSSSPYSFNWRDLRCGKHTLSVNAYDNAGNTASAEILIFKWRFHPILIIPLLILGWMWANEKP